MTPVAQMKHTSRGSFQTLAINYMKNPLDHLFEIYFFNLEERDKIFTRLQLNFAIYGVFIGGIAYVLRVIDITLNPYAVTLFFVGILASIILLTISIFWTCKSLTGMDYKLIPKAKKTLDYHEGWAGYEEKINEYNSEHNTNEKAPNPDKKTTEMLLRACCECSDYNLGVNEYRRKGIRKSLYYLLISVIPFLTSALIFIIFDLDSSSPRKTLQVNDESVATQLSQINEFYSDKPTGDFVTNKMEKVEMSDKEKKPSPPPPPPPPKPADPSLYISTESFNPVMAEKSKQPKEDK